MSSKSKKILVSSFLIVACFVFVLPALADGLTNPLGTANADPRIIVGNVIKALLGIVGSIALAVFIFGGFTWVTSAGNEQRVQKGKDMIMWAAFGLVVIFVSYALVTFVIGAITGGGGNGSAIQGQGDAVVPGQGDSIIR